MNYFNFDQDEKAVSEKKKVGAKPKHNFELMAIGETKPFPDGVKLSSLRVMLSVKGKDNNMKFSIDSNLKTICRTE